MTQAEFNEKLKNFTKSKVGIKILLPSLQLKNKYEEILKLYYIDELNHFEIADKLHMTKESVGNMLCKARKEMFDVITEQYGLFDGQYQEIIKILLNID